MPQSQIGSATIVGFLGRFFNVHASKLRKILQTNLLLGVGGSRYTYLICLWVNLRHVASSCRAQPSFTKGLQTAPKLHARSVHAQKLTREDCFEITCSIDQRTLPALKLHAHSALKLHALSFWGFAIAGLPNCWIVFKDWAGMLALCKQWESRLHAVWNTFEDPDVPRKSVSIYQAYFSVLFHINVRAPVEFPCHTSGNLGMLCVVWAKTGCVHTLLIEQFVRSFPLTISAACMRIKTITMYSF